MAARAPGSEEAGVGGGLAAVALLTSGSVLSLMTLPATFQLGLDPVAMSVVFAAVGGWGLFAAGVVLSVWRPAGTRGAAAASGAGARGADGPEHRAA